ncbi:hypothetical protein EW026_g4917 [Hermanssonia centrifuga]|uniref:Uncharacterized protein n=1 Tax=Hermanssonia centrifuga TaxID=98765 RepID=A0A4S4KFS1_9APHY|nr:hypothetical protein EW026_g4917 [Hermanssonia centrifuga]
MIRLLGSADGYNTESPERLHIDYAKDAYRASNKRDYTVQMVNWLRRQEAVDRFTAYIQFAQPQTPVPKTKVEPGTLIIQSTCGMDPSSFQLPSASSRISRAPARELKNISAARIIDDHKATQFLPAVKHYLRKHGCFLSPQPFDTFDLYKRDVVRAIPPVPRKGRRPAESAHMDFALIRVSERNEATVRTPLAGFRAAHVRVLFVLPEYFHIATKTPLAYVEWLTPFHHPDPDNGLFCIPATAFLMRCLMLGTLLRAEGAVHLRGKLPKHVDARQCQAM